MYMMYTYTWSFFHSFMLIANACISSHDVHTSHKRVFCHDIHTDAHIFLLKLIEISVTNTLFLYLMKNTHAGQYGWGPTTLFARDVF
jgi:hypothetical protein